MTSKKLIIAFLCLSFALFQGCGGSSQEENKAQQGATEDANGPSGDPQDMEEAMNEVQKALQGDGAKKEVVDFRQLKALLPEKLVGLERTAHNGEKVGALGFNMATASAEYRDGTQELEATIVDFAGVASALMGMADWSNVEIDREDENGYERTTNIEGYKAFEKYNSRARSGELSVLVGGCFIVSLKGRDIDEKAFRKAVEALNLKKLAKME